MMGKERALVRENEKEREMLPFAAMTRFLCHPKISVDARFLPDHDTSSFLRCRPFIARIRIGYGFWKVGDAFMSSEIIPGSCTEDKTFICMKWTRRLRGNARKKRKQRKTAKTRQNRRTKKKSKTKRQRI